MEESFNEEIKNKVWIKGKEISGFNSSLYRKDQCGAWISYKEYGNRKSNLGWEIDHIDCDRSNNSLSNLRPLQWKNNLDKSDGRLKCNVISDGNKNIDTSKQ